jgi:hypothetical protein
MFFSLRVEKELQPVGAHPVNKLRPPITAGSAFNFSVNVASTPWVKRKFSRTG